MILPSEECAAIGKDKIIQGKMIKMLIRGLACKRRGRAT